VPLDPQLATLLEFLASAETKPMSEGTPAEARQGFRTLSVDLRDPASVPEVGSVEDVTVPGAEGDLRARLYRPAAEGPLPTIVMLHGGGFVIGDLDTHDVTARTLANDCEAVVLSVDYRLAPEHPFPAAVDDASLAVRVVGAGRRVIVAGDSAGANLAAVCAQQLRLDPSTDIAGQILVYPVLDADIDRPSYVRNDGLVIGRLEMTWFFDHYVPNARDRSTPRFAPLRAARLDNLAPAVIAVAGHDPLYDEGVAYARRLEQAGVAVNLLDFDSLVHGFLRFTGPAPAALDAAMRIVVAAGALTSTRG
jgi:acetyl esterase